MSKIKQAEYVIFDVETTGLSPQYGDRIVEIAALKIKNLEQVDRFHSLIDPERSISYGAFQVNGITPEILEGAPTSDKVIPKFMSFAGELPLVGHNVVFDMGFLNTELLLLGIKPDKHRPVLDTLKMCRGLMPSLGGYSLEFVSRSLSIDKLQQHRAMADVELTYRVFVKLIDLAEQRSITNLRVLCRLFGSGKIGKSGKTDNTVAIIEEAIEQKSDIVLSYFSFGRGLASSRKVTPGRLTSKGKNTVLVGFCHMRNEERSFIVDRILHVEPA